ncbi:MAG: tetratricopeptide repeat protein [Phycisphaeraceae bacterium]
MKLRTKTKRRLTILTAIVIAFAALGGGTYFYLDTRRSQSYQDHLDDGLAAFERGAYEQSLHHLGSYLNSVDDQDVDIRYKYAVSRLQVPRDRGQHIGDAVAHFRHILEIDPSHHEAREHLLQAYLDINWNTEALETAEHVLARDETHRQALRTQLIATARLGQDAVALEHARAYLARYPDDVEMYPGMLHLMQRRGAGSTEILAAADAHVEALDDEALVALLRGLSHRTVQQWAEARDWYATAAELAPSDDVGFVRILTGELIATNQAGLALDVLKRAHDQTDDPQLHRMLVRRLWETGQVDEMIERIGSAATDDDNDRAELMLYQILALWQLDRRDEAQRAFDELRALDDASLADVWVPVLEVIQNPDATQAQILTALRTAAGQRPNDARLHFLLGRAYAAVGEPELAQRSWRRAAELAPGWPLPLLTIAQALAAEDDSQAATEAAAAALVHGEGRVDAVVSAIVARVSGLDPADTETAHRLLDAIAQVREAVPNESRTRRIEVMLHLNLGQRAQATQAIDDALAAEHPLPEQELLQLAAVAQEADLERAETLLDAAEAHHGRTPRLVAARAAHLARRGQPDAARELLEAAVADAASEDRIEWQIARLQFLDRLGRGDATDWAELLARHEMDATLLRAALGSPAVVADRQLTEQAIEQLRELTGESGVAWRVAKARWFLRSDHAERDAAQAASLLNQLIRDQPEHVDARLLMAQALLRLENPRRAIDQLDTAVAIAPDNPLLRLHLARLLQHQSRFDEARGHLRYVAESPAMPREHRRQAALLLSQQADHEYAANALSQLASADDAGARAERLALAALHQRQGRFDEAWQIVAEVLADDDAPEPGLILFAARLAHERGDADAGQRLLEQLDELEMPEFARHLARADFHAAAGDIDAAIDHATQAADIAPDHPAPWRQIILYHLSAGRIADAIDQAGLARQHLTEADPIVTLVDEHHELFRLLEERQGLAPIVRAALQESAHREAALQVLRIAQRVANNELNDREAVQALIDLADAHPRFATLQRFAIEQATLLGQPRNALERARDAIHRFPADARIAELAAHMLFAAGEHDEALAAADQWRHRVAGRTFEPDLLVARVQRARERSDAVLDRLAPHAERARIDPANHHQWYELQTWALVDARQHDAAASLLRPLLSQDASWRVLWRGRAETQIADPAVAAAWLDELDQHTPADALMERVALGGAWQGLGQRLDEPGFIDRARERLDALVAAHDTEAVVHFARGLLGEIEQDGDSAARHYRRALELGPDSPQSPVIRNNLAVVLTEHTGELDEARDLAQAAIATAPDMATFHDTLALVETRAERWDHALAAIDRAIELEPARAEWRVARAYILFRAGRTDDARAALADIDGRNLDLANLTERTQTRLQTLRDELAAELSQR